MTMPSPKKLCKSKNFVFEKGTTLIAFGAQLVIAFKSLIFSDFPPPYLMPSPLLPKNIKICREKMASCEFRSCCSTDGNQNSKQWGNKRCHE